MGNQLSLSRFALTAGGTPAVPVREIRTKRKAALSNAAFTSFIVCLKRLCIRPRMNQTPDAIRKQHIDLSGFDKSGNFTRSPNWMAHRLTGAISARAVVRLTIHGLRTALRQFGAVGE